MRSHYSYIALAREATANGDRIAAENFYQHAEHYFRINARLEGDRQGALRPRTPADEMDSTGAADSRKVEMDRFQWDGDDSGSWDRLKGRCR